jgi:hypothetical protein
MANDIDNASDNDEGKAGAAKNKLVRDSFTIPKAEYAVLNELKQRATRLTQPAKKTEILRAGVALLHSLSDKAFLEALAAVPNLKTGRPSKLGDEPADADAQAAPRPGRRVIDKTLPKGTPKAGSKAADKLAHKPAKADKPAKAARPEKAERAARKAAKSGS